MPDRSPSRLDIVADLHLEVGDDRGRTTARLTGDGGALVLEVVDPVVLLRAVPGRGPIRDLPIAAPGALASGLSLSLRSRQRDLGVVTVSETGRLRWRPSIAGLGVGAQVVWSVTRVRHVIAVAAGTVGAVAVLAAGVSRRRVGRARSGAHLGRPGRPGGPSSR